MAESKKLLMTSKHIKPHSLLYKKTRISKIPLNEARILSSDKRPKN
jgi:hypothetical protein